MGIAGERRPTLWEVRDSDRRKARAYTVLLLPVDVLVLSAVLSPVILIFAKILNIFGFGIGAQLGIAWLLALPTAAFIVPPVMHFASMNILETVGAEPTSPDGLHELKSSLEDMCLAAGLTATPRLWLIHSDTVNAMAVGMKPEDSSVAVTTGMLERLPLPQMRAVFAHLLARIVSGEIARATARAALVAAIPNTEKDSIQRAVKNLADFACWRSSKVLLEKGDPDALFLLKDPDAMLAALRSIDRNDNAILNAAGAIGNLFVSWPDPSDETPERAMRDRQRVRRVIRLRHEPLPREKRTEK